MMTAAIAEFKFFGWHLAAERAMWFFFFLKQMMKSGKKWHRDAMKLDSTVLFVVVGCIVMFNHSGDL